MTEDLNGRVRKMELKQVALDAVPAQVAAIHKSTKTIEAALVGSVEHPERPGLISRVGTLETTENSRKRAFWVVIVAFIGLAARNVWTWVTCSSTHGGGPQ